MLLATGTTPWSCIAHDPGSSDSDSDRCNDSEMKGGIQFVGAVWDEMGLFLKKKSISIFFCILYVWSDNTM